MTDLPAVYANMRDGEAQATYNAKRLAELEATALKRQERMAQVFVQDRSKIR